jgi:hypothetical protein
MATYTRVRVLQSLQRYKLAEVAYFLPPEAWMVED